jgi:hypothetical protein
MARAAPSSGLRTSMSVAVRASVADLKDGHPRAEKSAEMKYRPQRDADDREWDHCRRMAVHDCAHFGVGFVDFAMKKARNQGHST